MKLSPKQKKWAKRFLVLLLLRFVIGGVLYYIVVYRFKDLAQIAVKKESHGLYTFDASDVEFSLWKKSLVVEDAVLHCTDTLNTPIHHDLQIPRVYLSIFSWNDLLFRKKMEIDSMDIQLPVLRTHVHNSVAGPATANSRRAFSATAGPLTSDSVGAQTSLVLGVLQNLLTHLQVRVFTIRDGSFAYSNTKTNTPFLSNRINLWIRNFEKKTNRRDHLFSSDDVDLSIEDQQWNLPDGVHSLAFKRLHFSGKDQLFEMDSCYFHTAAVGDKGEIFFGADKLFFNSSQLSAIYEKGELLMDTLICFHPVLRLPKPDSQPKKDSSAAVNQAIRNLFKDINFKYIDIREGELLLGPAEGNQPAYGTKRTNLRIYNLDIHPSLENPITTDSIQLSLQKTQFLTRDSLFQLNIDELTLHNKDIVFTNASFGPTDRNRSDKNMQFTTHLLRLKDIDLEELMNKKLKAAKAELSEPVITVLDKGTSSNEGFSSDRGFSPHKNSSPDKSSSADKRKMPRIAGSETQKEAKDISHFYKTLHALGELIDVPDFRISDGRIGYQSTGRIPVSMQMNKLNAEIYLDRFLTSDSLIDIKRSLPQLTVKEIDVQSGNTHLRIDDYHFQGFNRHNGAGHLHLALQNGTVVDAKKLYWEILDWDQYQKYRIVMIETFKAGELAVNLKTASPQSPPVNQGEHSSDHDAGESGSGATPEQRKNLPVIYIGRVDIDRLSLTRSSSDGELRLEGKELCADEVNTTKKTFTWNNLQGQFNQFVLHKKNITASAGTILFDNGSESSLLDVNLDIKTETPLANGATRVQVPRLRLQLPVHSTDPLQWPSLCVALDQPVIEIYKDIPSSAKVNRDSATDMANPVSARPDSTNTIGASSTVIPVSYRSGRKGLASGLPFEIRIARLDIDKGRLYYRSEGQKDTLSLSAGLDLRLKGLQTSAGKSFQYDRAELAISSLQLEKGLLNLQLPHSTLALENGVAQNNDQNKLIVRTDLSLDWQDASLKKTKPGQMELSLQNLSGSFHANAFSSATFFGNQTTRLNTAVLRSDNLAGAGTIRLDKAAYWLILLDHTNLREGSLFYKSKQLTLQARSLQWKPTGRVFTLAGFNLTPNLSMEETFKKKGAWQADYMVASGDSVKVHGLQIENNPIESRLLIQKIELNGATLVTSRDKRMPFKHGQEKPMPTKLIATLPIPLRVDSIIATKCNVTVNEIAIATKKQGSIPLQNINATITHLSNQNEPGDSLSINANMQLLNNNIRHFIYREAYTDSLSSYRVSLNASPMNLPSFNKATIPLASVNVEQGQSDTLFAQWTGDKYASFGVMNFHYKALKVKLLDPSDAQRQTFLLKIENALANSLILNKSNSKESYVFFERDREKFVFNYWVKSALKGTLSSIGLKSNKKYLREYKKLRKSHPLAKTNAVPER